MSNEKRLALVALALCLIVQGCDKKSSATTNTAPPSAQSPAGAGSDLQTMEVAKAVMVTVELDFGKKIPTIAEALTEIERRHQPDDGQGRTFAVLDAYGEPTPEGRLHISMHVSSERPGTGSLVFKRTGEVLWTARITGQPVSPVKNLTILIDDGAGRTFTIDGSNNPQSILDAKIQGRSETVREFWPDKAEREFTFIYSACGCPVKVKVKRAGDRTVRTSDRPVIFPDDPAAVTTISRLMRWQ
jgi:hypothetical protein